MFGKVNLQTIVDLIKIRKGVLFTVHLPSFVFVYVYSCLVNDIEQNHVNLHMTQFFPTRSSPIWLLLCTFTI
jgi:hypothetical protein